MSLDLTGLFRVDVTARSGKAKERSVTMLTASEPDVRLEGPDRVMPDRPDQHAPARSIRSPSKRARRALSTGAWFGVSVLVIAIYVVLDNNGVPSPIVSAVGLVGSILFGFATLTAAYRAVCGVLALAGLVQTETTATTDRRIAAILENLLMAGFGMFVAYFATVGFSRGRQIRRFGRVLLPTLRPDRTWARSASRLEGRENVPAGVADRWRENGKTEHASVAAFARLTLDLMALGAPPRLITAANQDALDEIRHAELCFSLAHMLDGASLSPAPFPQVRRASGFSRSRTLALAKLAVDSLVDGALHEGVSARIIARLARRCEVPTIREALKGIAADEGRHAAHGWAVMEWCLDEGGSPVRRALLGAIRTLPNEMRSELPEGAADGEWERWGIHGHRLESEEYSAALAHLVQRVQATVAGRPRRVA